MKNDILKTDYRLIITLFLISVILIAAIIYGIRYFMSKLPDPTVTQTAKEINPDNLHFTKAQYEQKADDIYNALSSIIFTDTSTIYNTLESLNNIDDWNALFVAFGKRDNKNLLEYLHGDVGLAGTDKFPGRDTKSILAKIGVSY